MNLETVDEDGIDLDSSKVYDKMMSGANTSHM